MRNCGLILAPHLAVIVFPMMPAARQRVTEHLYAVNAEFGLTGLETDERRKWESEDDVACALHKFMSPVASVRTVGSMIREAMVLSSQECMINSWEQMSGVEVAF